MNREKPTAVETGGRWLRVGMLTFTVVGPMIRTLVEFMRQPKQPPEEQASEIQNNISISEAMALSQLDDVALARRQRAAQQARQLRRQSKQLRAQAKQLRQSLRTESKQRRQLNKLIKQLQEAGIDWNQELQQRTANLAAQGSNLTSDLLERSNQLTENAAKRSTKLLKRGRQLSQQAVEQSGDTINDWTERGSQLTHDLMKRGSDLGHDVAERSSHLTHDLVKHSSEVTHNLGKQSQKLLEPARKRNSTFWTTFGFSLGLVIATIVTYRLVRRRLLQQAEDEQSQHIELPQSPNIIATPGPTRPTGEIHHTDADGTAVATLQAVDVAGDKVEVPADATFVGVIATKQYYPITQMPDAPDLVFFITQEEAKTQGFSLGS
jgi:hypothetical protein